MALDNQTSTPLDAAAISRLIREELSQRDTYFTFAQKQVKEVSGLYKTLFAIAGGLLTVIAVAGAGISYKSITDMRAEMKEQSAEMQHKVESELALDKEAMKELREDVAHAKTEAVEAQAKVKGSLNNVHKEVEGRLNTEFSSENIKQSMKSVATDKVKDTVIKELNPLINTATFATLALADDRKAFDYLRQISLGNSPESTNPDLRKIAKSVTEKIIQDSEASKLNFANPNLNDVPLNSMGDVMAIKNTVIRQMALDKFMGNHPNNAISFLPMLVEMIKDDPSLDVLYAAVTWFNKLTNQKQAYKFYQEAEILDWWEKNKAQFR